MGDITADAPVDPQPDLVTLGETMVVLVPAEPGALVDATKLLMHVGGAESNVAGFLASLGFRALWSGLVGDDIFGDVVLHRLAERGIDTRCAVRLAGERTGFYVKEQRDGHTVVRYARADSASTLLSPEHLRDERLQRSRVLHLSGITPALSPSARDLVLAGIDERRDSANGGRTISFDVNFRPLLWSAEVAGPELARIANRCDLVFVGLDEAQSLWGCETVADVRELIPDAGAIVVKDGAVGAFHLSDDTGAEPVFVAAPRVHVIEQVGAGDAFAAGYLGAMLAGWSVPQRLRLGHLVAAHALSVLGDDVAVPALNAFEPLCRISAEGWAGLSFDVALEPEFGLPGHPPMLLTPRFVDAASGVASVDLGGPHD